MEKEFKKIEQEFEQLKREFQQGEISRPQFIEGLKKLRFKDEEGRFWMVGAHSGKWYYYDGQSWIQSNPPSIEEGKAICIHCGFENSLEAEVCVRCGQSLVETDKYCPHCGSRIEDPELGCPYCNQPEVQGAAEEEVFEEKKGTYSVVRSLNPFSSLIFFGTVGIFVGLILGAFAGTTDAFEMMVILLPAFFNQIQGTLLGGIMFSLLGGVIGVILLGFFGFLFALFFNFVSSFAGGIKIRLD